jgi:hypothetical protein
MLGLHYAVLITKKAIQRTVKVLSASSWAGFRPEADEQQEAGGSGRSSAKIAAEGSQIDLAVAKSAIVTSSCHTGSTTTGSARSS